MSSVMKTLFLNPPSFEKFDGGAGSRWPATREIESYWYPVWLAYPAGMLPGSRLLDGPPHHITPAEVVTPRKTTISSCCSPPPLVFTAICAWPAP